MGVDRVRDIGWRMIVRADPKRARERRSGSPRAARPPSREPSGRSRAAPLCLRWQSERGANRRAPGLRRRGETRSTKAGAKDWGRKGVAPEPLAFGKLAQCQEGNWCLLHRIWVVFSQHVRACGSYCAATDAPPTCVAFFQGCRFLVQSGGDRCDPHLTVVIAEHQLLNAWLLSRPTERRAEYVRRSFYALARSGEPRRGRGFRTVGYPCTQTHVYSLRYS
jgi:hypothetical protein